MVRDMLKIFVGDVLRNISNYVGKHDLFEQDGERPKAKPFSEPPLKQQQNNSIHPNEKQDLETQHNSQIEYLSCELFWESLNNKD